MLAVIVDHIGVTRPLKGTLISRPVWVRNSLFSRRAKELSWGPSTYPGNEESNDEEK